MKQYNFDEIVDRRGTNCIKVDALKARYGNPDLTPLWVADMDFRTPDFIVNALKERCKHEVFGYTFADDDYYNSIINWVDYKHNWKISRESLSYIPGIVKGIAFALQCFTNPGDKVLIQSPVYHPFRLVPEKMKRTVVYNPLKLTEGVYQMDFEQLESVIEGCKVLILCNPHNPAGIVWNKETLSKLADICARHGVLVISDEIHAELTYPQYPHLPFAKASETAANISITFMAPSKTFNIAGLNTSYVIIPCGYKRELIRGQINRLHINRNNIFGVLATKEVYKSGEEWLKNLLLYLEKNADTLVEFIETRLPKIKVVKPEGTFLAWLDFSAYFDRSDELNKFLIEKANLGLNSGISFGEQG